MSDDSKKILDDAATRRADESAAVVANKVEVRGIDNAARKARNPFRTIRIAWIDVPACTQYPKGAELAVMPRQIDAHLKRFPGSTLLRVETHTRLRAINPSNVDAKGLGHGFGFLKGRDVRRTGDGGTAE